MQDRFSIRLGLVVDWLMFKDTVEAFGRQEFWPESKLTKFAYQNRFSDFNKVKIRID
jgi:hypothetical protein